jgi:hypothetical protein
MSIKMYVECIESAKKKAEILVKISDSYFNKQLLLIPMFLLATSTVQAHVNDFHQHVLTK